MRCTHIVFMLPMQYLTYIFSRGMLKVDDASAQLHIVLTNDSNTSK